MLNMGWIQFDMAAAMVLGENLGTTITANLAASIGSVNAKRAALAHTVFNLFGVTGLLFHHLLDEVNLRGQVVGEAIEPHAAGMGAEPTEMSVPAEAETTRVMPMARMAASLPRLRMSIRRP